MADLLQTASDWLQSQRAKFMSRGVIYQRGEVTLDIAATIGQTVFEVDDGTGAALRVESRDFLITANDLQIGGQFASPQRGDRITETDGAATYVYEVMAPGDEPCWRYSDPYRRTFRIHTKQVDAS